jgi:hypothetical protein
VSTGLYGFIYQHLASQFAQLIFKDLTIRLKLLDRPVRDFVEQLYKECG